VWAQVPPEVQVRLVGGGFPWTELVVAFVGGLLPAVVAILVVMKGGKDQAEAQRREFADRDERWKGQRRADAERWVAQQEAEAERWADRLAHERGVYLRAERRQAYAAVNGAGLQVVGMAARLVMADPDTADAQALGGQFEVSEKALDAAISSARLVASDALTDLGDQVRVAMLDSFPLPTDLAKWNDLEAEAIRPVRQALFNYEQAAVDELRRYDYELAADEEIRRHRRELAAAKERQRQAEADLAAVEADLAAAKERSKKRSKKRQRQAEAELAAAKERQRQAEAELAAAKERLRHRH
jgi:hypothetical protein